MRLIPLIYSQKKTSKPSHGNTFYTTLYTSIAYMVMNSDVYHVTTDFFFVFLFEDFARCDTKCVTCL